MGGVGGVEDGVAAGATERDEVENGAGAVVAEGDSAHAGDQEGRAVAAGGGKDKDAAEVRKRLGTEDVGGGVGHDGEEEGDEDAGGGEVGGGGGEGSGDTGGRGRGGAREGQGEVGGCGGVGGVVAAVALAGRWGCRGLRGRGGRRGARLAL